MIYYQSVYKSLTLWENVIFSAAINDRCMKFSVKTPMTYALFIYSTHCVVRLSVAHAPNTIILLFLMDS